MHYYCQCLNITIDVLEIHDNQQTPTNFLITDLNPSQEWFECNIVSDKSIHVTWQCFFQSITNRDMKLNRCLACNQYTHIINNQSNKILINKDLLNDRTVKDSFNDPNYSKISKIILPSQINNPSMRRLSDSQGIHLDETSQRECKLVQQLYRQSLEDADRETEEKIRMYQHEQERILKLKTDEINKELDTFLSFIRSLQRSTLSTKTSPISQTSVSYINENSMESGFGSDIFDTNGNDLSRQSSVFERALSERTSNFDDDLFLDNTDLSNYATSLPKDIAFAIPRNDSHDIDSHDLERIGESFRELSQSLMCTDGTELFGDLPSPRLNATQT